MLMLYDPGMTFRERALRQPQTLWIRRALFQIHLWTGIGVGLYIVVISLSGSAVVFRRELMRSLATKVEGQRARRVQPGVSPRTNWARQPGVPIPTTR